MTINLKTVLVGIGLLILFLWWAGANHPSPHGAHAPESSASTEPSAAGSSAQSGGSYVVAQLRQKQTQCRENVRALEAMGAARLADVDGSTFAEYDEANWAALDHDDKIRQALLIYCAKMPADGHWSVIIQGRHDGKTMASITDGNYFDN